MKLALIITIKKRISKAYGKDKMHLFGCKVTWINKALLLFFSFVSVVCSVICDCVKTTRCVVAR